MARAGRGGTLARNAGSVARRLEAIGLTGRDDAIARQSGRTTPGYGVVVVDIGAGHRRAAARAAIGLRRHP